MKRKTVGRGAAVEEILQRFAELGIVRTVSLPVPTVETKNSSSEWGEALRPDARTQAQRYAHVRDMPRVPLALASGSTIRLSARGQNALGWKIINKSCPRFAPGGKPVYVRGTDKQWPYFDACYLRNLGVVVEEHGKMPNVVVHFTKRNWLFLIDPVACRGPVNTKRLTELMSVFAGSKAGLVFVTAVSNRRDLLKYAGDIAWGTGVWIASEPDHMVHFNGGRFLGRH
ncbi:MAG: BsuBI/PstI family type II restriction endonuclease [Terriglobia bacterium]